MHCKINFCIMIIKCKGKKWIKLKINFLINIIKTSWSKYNYTNNLLKNSRKWIRTKVRKEAKIIINYLIKILANYSGIQPLQTKTAMHQLIDIQILTKPSNNSQQRGFQIDFTVLWNSKTIWLNHKIKNFYS